MLRIINVFLFSWVFVLYSCDPATDSPKALTMDLSLLKVFFEHITNVRSDIDFLHRLACVCKTADWVVTEKLQKRLIQFGSHMQKVDPNYHRIYSPDKLACADLGLDKNAKEELVYHTYLVGDDGTKKRTCRIQELDCQNSTSADIVPFFINHTAWVFASYSSSKKHCALMIGINEEHLIYAKLCIKLQNILIPSGWLWCFLPKLHDTIMQQRTKKYYTWDELCKQPNIDINSQVYAKGFPYHGDIETQGVVVVDIASTKCISENDKRFLSLFLPQYICQYTLNKNIDFDDPGLQRVPYSNIIANMHYEWGRKERVFSYIDIHPSLHVKYKIKNYGTFDACPLTERISYMSKKKLSNKRRTYKEIVQGIKSNGALAFLETKKAFRAKDWYFSNTSIESGLKELSATRYIFKKNGATEKSDKLIAIIDTLAHQAYIIELYCTYADNKLHKDPYVVATHQLAQSIDYDTFKFSEGYDIQYIKKE